jgi:rhodanese-related sulfurtransferase
MSRVTELPAADPTATRTHFEGLLGAVSLPHGKINEQNLAAYAADTLFVVYCNGPHCNGADRAAARLARLGRPVKKMIGGVEGWKDEGFRLVTADRTR